MSLGRWKKCRSIGAAGRRFAGTPAVSALPARGAARRVAGPSRPWSRFRPRWCALWRAAAMGRRPRRRAPQAHRLAGRRFSDQRPGKGEDLQPGGGCGGSGGGLQALASGAGARASPFDEEMIALDGFRDARVQGNRRERRPARGRRVLDARTCERIEGSDLQSDPHPSIGGEPKPAFAGDLKRGAELRMAPAGRIPRQEHRDEQQVGEQAGQAGAVDRSLGRGAGKGPGAERGRVWRDLGGVDGVGGGRMGHEVPPDG